MRIGSCKFDPETRKLTRGQRELVLPPRAAAVLACLANAPGTVVPLREIRRTVWSEVHVTRKSVTEAFSVARVALGPVDSEWILSVRACGYILRDPSSDSAAQCRPAPSGIDLATVAGVGSRVAMVVLLLGLLAIGLSMVDMAVSRPDSAPPTLAWMTLQGWALSDVNWRHDFVGAPTYDRGAPLDFALSPDATRLLTSEKGKLRVDELGGDRTTDLPGSGWVSPVWLPDGIRVAAGRHGGGLAILQTREATVERVLLPDLAVTPTGTDPTTGDVIVTITSGGAKDVGLVSLQTESIRRVLASTANESAAVISPDGRSIAFTSDVTGNEAIYVAGYPWLSKRVRVAEVGGIQIRWSTLGRTLLFLRSTDDALFSVDLRDDPPVLTRVLGGIRAYDTRAAGGSLLVLLERRAFKQLRWTHRPPTGGG